MAEDEKLPIMGHLRELRKRIMRMAIAVVITTAISFIFVERFFEILKSRADNVDLIYVEMTEMFSTYFTVALYSGFALATPVILYEIVMFIRPALTPREKKYLYSLLPGVLIAFAIGVVFAYYVLIPPATNFLLTFGNDIATPQIRVGNYVSLVVRLIFLVGLCFELPVVIYFLAKIKVVTVKKLSRFRRYAFLGAFVIAALATPTPDPFNQALVAVPLYLLYEVGILLARVGGPRGSRVKSR